ncbi:hypothetical protein [Streptomyces shenzhenensis]|uniref:hypothetical protein n=1 Tax=Streptomyces shenzhenensis TaxID=943815 RepID=UPI0016051BDB|nr:hypothetical protein [Streptomyces shenzhenensis]
MHVTLLTLIAALVGFAVGVYASHVGDLTFYEASGVGTVGAVTVFTAGMMILDYIREQ